MQFDRGYLSPYFVTNPEKMTVELENPYILIHEKKLSNLQAMLPMLEAVVQVGPSAADHRRGHRRRSAGHPRGQQAARRPQGRSRQGTGLRRSPQGDAAGHRDPDQGRDDLRRSRHQARERHRSACSAKPRRVTIDKDNTTIVDGAGDGDDIKARVEQIRSQIETTTSPTTTRKSCRSASPSSPAALP